MPVGKQLATAVQPLRVSNAVAAGTTDVNTTVVDTANSDGVRFTVLFGTLTSSQTTFVKLQGGSLANGADMADLLDSTTGTVIKTANLADADSNKIAVIEVYKPKVRYVRAVIDRGTANAVIDGATAQLILNNPLPYTSNTTSVAVTAKGDFARV